MKKLLWLLPAVLSFAFLAGGCRTDAYYQDRAVEKARAFLLKNAPELTPEQSYYVKFNRPVLLAGEILGRKNGSKAFGPELKQICVSWRIPGLEEEYLVYGVSQGRMDYWSPDRLIRKKFEKFSLPLESAMNIARTYAQNFQYRELNRFEFNYLRFGFPYVIRTSFDWMYDADGTLTEEELEAERKTWIGDQLSLVWRFPDGGMPLVFCGASKPDLSGWRINFAGRMSEAELESKTVEVLKTPENAQTLIEVPEETAPGAKLPPGFGAAEAKEAIPPGKSVDPIQPADADDLPAPPSSNIVEEEVR